MNDETFDDMMKRTFALYDEVMAKWGLPNPYPSQTTPSTPEATYRATSGQTEVCQPIKVRPSEVDDGVCKGIVDEISEADPDREWVWRHGLSIVAGVSNGRRYVFADEGTARAAASRLLAMHPGFYRAGEPYPQELAAALSEPPCTATPIRTVQLLDANLNVLREWKVT